MQTSLQFAFTCSDALTRAIAEGSARSLPASPGEVTKMHDQQHPFRVKHVDRLAYATPLTKFFRCDIAPLDPKFSQILP
ncbi:hypothetical protein Rcae01_00529 [Novipirellula caenicola]|uniref:Uncharacterized protein n=1 Tax=Novipirellula caenicola TaxID=1536901 RepID=A0ABP9VNT9_9BACT